MTRIHAFIALGMLGAGAALGAQSGAQPRFESLDKNADGKVSLNEAADHDGLFVAFKNLDANKDGILTREEFAAFRKPGP